MEISALLAFTGTVIAIVLLRPLAGKLQLLDVPTERKKHVGAIPLIGGLAVSIGVYLSVFMTMPLSLPLMMLLLCAGAMLLIGAVDDACDISPKLRLGLQAMLIVVLCLSTDVGLCRFGNLVGQGDIRLPWGEVVVAVLAVCAAINAFNMMDGIDGLAGSMAGISLLGLSVLFSNTMPDMATFCLVIAIALLPYLALNLTIPPFKHKIFMGDAGSMFLGFIIGFLVIYGSQVTEQPTAFRPVMALWLMGLPLIDMVGIMVRRIRKGQSPLKADRNHLHHILLHAGFTHREALLLMVMTNLGIVFMGIVAEMATLPEWLMMAIYMILFAGYSCLVSHAWRLGRWVKACKGNPPHF